MMGEDAGRAELDESVGGFSMFEARARSRKGHTDTYWRTGFLPAHRMGTEDAIVRSVFAVYSELFGGDLSPGGTLLDVGGGSGELCLKFTLMCEQLGWKHVVIDSAAMLSHLPPHPNRQKIGGRFPDILTEYKSLEQSNSLIVAYSVIQYAVREMPMLDFIDGICRCLRPGGVALIGDIPNRDKRSRHLVATGVDPSSLSDTSGTAISDDMVLAAVEQLRIIGLDAYCLPQGTDLKTWEHREDLWIQRPDSQPYLEVWE